MILDCKDTVFQRDMEIFARFFSIFMYFSKKNIAYGVFLSRVHYIFIIVRDSFQNYVINPNSSFIIHNILYLCGVNEKKYLQSLISQGEHQQQDFKYKVQDALKLARSVSAFANTDGGRLLVGVRDDGHLSGVRSEEEIYMLHQAAYRYCTPEASIKFDTFHVDGRTIVIATVPPSQKKPVYAIDEQGKRRAYLRINDENIVASPVHLQLWRMECSPRGQLLRYGEAEQSLLVVLSAATVPLTLNQLVRRSRLSRSGAVGLLARFMHYGLVTCLYADQRFLFSAK